MLAISAELVGMRENDEPNFLPNGNFLVLVITASGLPAMFTKYLLNI